MEPFTDHAINLRYIVALRALLVQYDDYDEDEGQSDEESQVITCHFFVKSLRRAAFFTSVWTVIFCKVSLKSVGLIP